jgi:hypothetical protein
MNTLVRHPIPHFLRSALCALAFGAAAFAQADTYRHGASGFECPDQLAGFTRTGVDDYESKEPGLGVACKYQLARDLFVDVYIYTAGMESVPKDVNDPLILQLHAQTLREIEQFAQMRGEQPQRLRDAKLEVSTDAGPVSVLYDSFLIDSKSGRRNTWVWLWTARNHVMKIRMTRPPSGNPDPNVVREFYETVVRMAGSHGEPAR